MTYSKEHVIRQYKATETQNTWVTITHLLSGHGDKKLHVIGNFMEIRWKLILIQSLHYTFLFVYIKLQRHDQSSSTFDALLG